MAPPTVKDEVRHSSSPDIESLVFDDVHEVRRVFAQNIHRSAQLVLVGALADSTAIAVRYLCQL